MPERLDAVVELVRLWQRRLRLQDWEIHVQIIPWHKLSSRSHGAEMEFWRPPKRAMLKLLERGHYPTSSFDLADDEYSIVHELIHLHLAVWRYDSEKDEQASDAEEAVVVALATALVGLARGEEPDGRARAAESADKAEGPQGRAEGPDQHVRAGAAGEEPGAGLPGVAGR
jgi:hypothetical protein